MEAEFRSMRHLSQLSLVTTKAICAEFYLFLSKRQVEIDKRGVFQ